MRHKRLWNFAVKPHGRGQGYQMLDRKYGKFLSDLSQIFGKNF